MSAASPSQARVREDRLDFAQPMRDERPEAVTDLLRRWQDGEEAVAGDLMLAVYPELHRLAARYLRGERRDHTLQPTALVNEAYLRLVAGDVVYNDRVHFLAIAATVMRRVLVDHAKAKKAQKRGGHRLRVTLDDGKLGDSGSNSDVLALDEALSSLAELDERKSRTVELHYFGGLTYDEMATAMGVSVATVNRELRFAKAWLADALEGES